MKGMAQFVIKRIQRIRQGFDATDRRHKISVSNPAGNNVHMKMAGDSGTGCLTHIKTNI